MQNKNSEYNFQETCVVWNEQHALLLKNLLNSFDVKGIRYVILKNDGGLPFINHSKDVDIVIEPGSYKLAAEVIRECYKNNGVSHYRIHKFERLRCWYGMNPDTHFAIHIDLLEGFLHKGFEMFPFEVLYTNSVRNENGVQVLNELMGNVVLLLHSTICYHSIKDKYAKSISQAYHNYQSEFVSLLKGILGESAADEMNKYLSSDNYQDIAKLGKHFSHCSKMRLLIRHPLFSITNVLDFLWEKCSRLILNLERYNVFISVHAPDGTGKTTFIEHFGNELGYFYVCSANDLLSTHHFRPCVLPNLGAAGEKVGVMKQDKDFTNPHRAKPVGKISSIVRMAYYWFDYVFGVPLILRKNAQFDKITVFDRYIYDFLVDPQRARINLPFWLRRLFTRLVKQPRIVFVLDTDAETIYRRKQELTKDEIKRQLSEFRRLSSLDSRVYFLDASKKPNEIANDAIKIIIDTFTKKI